MDIWEIITIGVALAMDAFAVTVSNCTTYERSLDKRKAWSMPAAFALFQFLMPVIGFYIGHLFYDFIASFSSFLTAGIFFLLAVKIVFDKIEERKKSANGAANAPKTRNFTVKVLLSGSYFQFTSFPKLPE